MDCKHAENLVLDYINGTMGRKELGEFLAHVKCCSSCYEELQTYFTVYFAMEHLDNMEDDASFNINMLLLEDLRQKERYVKRENLKRFLFPAICILFVLFVLLLVY